MYKQIIDNLALARMQQGHTLQSVADELGIHKATLWCWECHKSRPTYDMFLDWVKLFKIDLNDFIK